jgi:hypothetical protein
VELHEASGDDYADLHKAMKRHGYTREIKTARGTWQLPTAEYNLEGSLMETSEVRDEALEIAKSVKPKPTPWILVTKSQGRAWSSWPLSPPRDNRAVNVNFRTRNLAPDG